MRYLVLVTIAGLVASTSAIATSANAAGGSTAKMVATAHTFIDAFNKGDAAGAAATHAADVTIIDEVPPHMWRGPKAFATWAADLAADDKKNGITEENVALGKTQRAVIDGDTGYAVLKATYTYKLNGVATAEAATMTFALKSGKDGWKITAWSWDGTVPKPVAPAK
jgi:ketosteroid isomerase-like protein